MTFAIALCGTWMQTVTCRLSINGYDCIMVLHVRNMVPCLPISFAEGMDTSRLCASIVLDWFRAWFIWCKQGFITCFDVVQQHHNRSVYPVAFVILNLAKLLYSTTMMIWTATCVSYAWPTVQHGFDLGYAVESVDHWFSFHGLLCFTRHITCWL